MSYLEKYVPKKLRCLVKRDGNQWIAICIDLNLASQSDSYKDAKEKLVKMIKSYVYEALVEDKEYARQLLSRKAPLEFRIQYHIAAYSHQLHQWFNAIPEAYTAPMPSIPKFAC